MVVGFNIPRSIRGLGKEGIMERLAIGSVDAKDVDTRTQDRLAGDVSSNYHEHYAAASPLNTAETLSKYGVGGAVEKDAAGNTTGIVFDTPKPMELSATQRQSADDLADRIAKDGNFGDLRDTNELLKANAGDLGQFVQEINKELEKQNSSLRVSDQIGATAVTLTGEGGFDKSTAYDVVLSDGNKQVDESEFNVFSHTPGSFTLFGHSGGDRHFPM